MALALVADLLVVTNVSAGVRILTLVNVASALVGVVPAVVLTVAKTFPRDATPVLAVVQSGTFVVISVWQKRGVVG